MIAKRTARTFETWQKVLIAVVVVLVALVLIGLGTSKAESATLRPPAPTVKIVESLECGVPDAWLIGASRTGVTAEISTGKGGIIPLTPGEYILIDDSATLKVSGAARTKGYTLLSDGYQYYYHNGAADPC